MKIFSQASVFFPKYAKYFKHNTASGCIKHLIKNDKKGKNLSKFLMSADTNKFWKGNFIVQQLVDKAIETTISNPKLKKAKETLQFLVFLMKAQGRM
jgi:hypothetical protein